MNPDNPTSKCHFYRAKCNANEEVVTTGLMHTIWLAVQTALGCVMVGCAAGLGGVAGQSSPCRAVTTARVVRQAVFLLMQ